MNDQVPDKALHRAEFSVTERGEATLEIAASSRILLVTRNFPPLVGGMERLLHHVFLELAATFDVALCAPTGASRFISNRDQVIEIRPTPAWRFLLGSAVRGAIEARRKRSAVVFSGSGLTALPAWLIARVSGARLVTYVHGLDLVASHPLYRALFLPAIRRCNLVLANSESTGRLAAAAGVPADRIRVLHPGVELPTPPGAEEVARFRSEITAGNRPMLLSVGRLTPRKGLAEFIDKSLPAIVAAVPNVLLVVIGGIASDAVARHGDRVLEEIRQAVRSRRLERNVLVLGPVSEERLHLAYGAASALVFPVREMAGDIEGFGMVALEAAAHDVPTVAFDVGGISDAVADNESGYLVSPGRYGDFAAATIGLLKGQNRLADCRRFANGFAWSAFGDRLRAIIHEGLATSSTGAGK